MTKKLQKGVITATFAAVVCALFAAACFAFLPSQKTEAATIDGVNVVLDSESDFWIEDNVFKGFTYDVYNNILNNNKYSNIEVVIPDNITEIAEKGMQTYLYRDGKPNTTQNGRITTVRIPSSVVKIGKNAFNDVNNVADVYYNGTFEQWLSVSFENNGSSPLHQYHNWHSSNYGNLYVKETAESAAADHKVTLSGEVEIPANVESLSAGLLGINDDIIQKITFAGNTVEIAPYAFYELYDLAAIELPASLKRIGGRAFYDTAITEITLPVGFEQMIDYTFGFDSQLATIKYDGTPEQFVSIFIEDNPFSYDGGSVLFKNEAGEYAAITDYALTVPADVSALSASLMGVGLASIDMTQAVNLTKISSYAFSGQSKLISITVPETVESIGYGAFENCALLETLVIPSSVTSMESCIVADCPKLKYLTVPFLGYDAHAEDLDGVGMLTNLFGYDKTTDTENYVNITQVREPGTSSTIQTETGYLPKTLTKVTVLGGNIILGAFSSINSRNLADPGENFIPVTEIELGNAVKRVGDYAFAYAKNLETIKMDGVTEIGTKAFIGTKIPSETNEGWIYQGGQLLGIDEAWLTENNKNKTDITSVTVKEGTKSIAADAFKGFTKLETLVVPVGMVLSNMYDSWSSSYPVKNIYVYGGTADSLYSDLTINTYNFREFKLYSGKPNESPVEATKFIVPDGTETMDNYIITSSSGAEVHIPASVKKVTYSGGLSSLNIKKDIYITDIAAWCAIDFTVPGDSLTNLTCSNPLTGNDLYVNNVLVTELTIPAGVKTIMPYAFYGSKLTKVVICNDVEVIGDSAFGNCGELVTVEIDKEASKLHTLDTDCFTNCKKLTAFTFPVSLVTINDKKEAIFGGSLLDASPFNGCVALATVTDWTEYDESTKTTRLNVSFDNLGANGGVSKYAKRIINRGGAKELFDTEDGIYTFMEDGVNDVNWLYKYKGTTDTELTLPASYKSGSYSIFKYAFAGKFDKVGVPPTNNNVGYSGQIPGYIHDVYTGNSKLVKITIPVGSVDKIDDWAFLNCTALVDVIINDVDELGIGVFKSCTKLKTVAVSGGMQAIGAAAFAQCHALEEFSVNDGGIVSIGEYAFLYCDKLVSIVLPDSVESIDNFAFYGCESLQVAVFGNNIQTIGERAFYRTKLKSVTLPASLKVIGPEAFYYCQSLESVTFLGNYISEINRGAFSRTNLVDVKLPAKVDKLGSGIFTSCSKLLSVTLPVDLSAVEIQNSYSCMFSYSSAVKTVYLPSKGSMTDEKYLSLITNMFTPMSGSSTGNPKSAIYVAPDKASYDCIKSDTDYYMQKEVLSQLFYVTDVTLVLMGGGNEVAKDQNYKMLVRDCEVTYTSTATTVTETGAELKYLYQYGYWVKTDGISLPTSVGIFDLEGGAWTVKEGEKEAVELTEDFRISSANKDNLVFTYTTAEALAKVNVPRDEYTEYTGSAWAFEYDDYLTVTRVLNGKGGTVDNNKPINADTYTVYVTPKTGYTWTDGSVAEKSFKLVIAPVTISVVWTFNGSTEIPELEYTGETGRIKLMKAAYVLGGNEVTFITVAYKVDGDNKTGVQSIVNAGTYSFEIITDNYPNYVILNPAQTIVVAPAEIVIDSAFVETYVFGGAGTLNHGGVYVYKKGANEYKYAHSQLDLTIAENVGYELIEIRNTINSIAMYSGEVINLGMSVAGANFTVDMSGEKSGTDAGMYTAIVTLTAATNYRFVMSDLTNVAARGLSFAIGDSGEVEITKVWYILAFDNMLVSADGATPWSIATEWTFGEDPQIALPHLLRGDADNTKVMFRLRRGMTYVTSAGFYRTAENGEGFEYYVNATMPVGSYRLEATIYDVSENGVVYVGGTQIFDFTVKAANIGFDMTADKDTGYANYEWKYDAANRDKFFADFVKAIDESEALSFTSVTPVGHWASEQYTGHSITYNFARMYSNTYYDAENASILGAIAGGVNGTYTVYFQVSAPNHNDLTALNNSRYAYFFTVTVYEEIETPTFDASGLVYTGNKVQPEIKESGLYEIVWTDGDTYIGGGAHKVSFKLYDKVHYRWADSETDTVEVPFDIAKANNAWVRVPNIVNWTFETFDTKINRIRAVVKYLDGGKTISFTVLDGTGKAVAGLDGFTVKDDGTIDNAAVVKALNGLPVGAYKLKVAVEGTGNYEALEQTIDFNIGKSMNAWADGEDDLKLPSWIVGQYDPQENVIAVKPEHGEAIIIITNIDGDVVYYDSRKPSENTLNDMEVGKYLLKAWVEESENFAALAERTFTIEVFEKVGLPWWATTLIAVGALMVAAIIILILWKKGVFQILTGKIVLAIRTRATIDATIAAVRAAKRSEQAKKSVAEAEARDAAEARAQARKEAAEAERQKPIEERAAVLESKAQETSERADRMKARADKMKARVERMKKQAQMPEAAATETPEATENTDDKPEE